MNNTVNDIVNDLVIGMYIFSIFLYISLSVIISLPALYSYIRLFVSYVWINSVFIIALFAILL